MKKLKKIEGSCAVIAVHYCAGKDEGTVLRVCRSLGFTPEDGMDDEDWQEAARILGVEFIPVSMKKQKLRKFIREYSKGLFLVGTVDHLFVIDNGVIVDPRHPTPPGLDRVIRQAWIVS